MSFFLLKARVLNLTISKRKNSRLPLKVETDQFVFCLVLPECLSVKICCISPSDSEANRDGSDANSPFPFFSCMLFLIPVTDFLHTDLIFLHTYVDFLHTNKVPSSILMKCLGLL